MATCGVIATFDYPSFILRFPEFGKIAEPLVADMWDEATTWHRNDGTLPVKKVESQQRYLNYMTAHLLQLFYGSTLQKLSPLVGTITSANEGSVGVVVRNILGESPTAAWYNQTKYGAAYWSMIQPYKLFRYVPGRPRVFDPFRLY